MLDAAPGSGSGPLFADDPPCAVTPALAAIRSCVTAGSSALTSWKVTLNLPSGVSIQNIWSGVNAGTTGTVVVSNAPYTFHGLTPGKPFGLDLDLFSTAYDVPAGHRLALVVDTVDPLYIEHNPSGAQLTFSSAANDPSYVSRSARATSRNSGR